MRIAVIGRSELLFEAAAAMLRAGHQIGLVVTAKEAPEYEKGVEDFQQLATTSGALFLRTNRIANHVETIAALGAMDLAISVNFPAVIPQTVIDCFPLGILNAHAGDLPRYRGNAPLAWAILNGEQHAGLCIHQMIGGELDSGDIIARDYHSIGPSTTITELWAWVRARTPELFVEAASRLAEDATYLLERQSPDPLLSLRGFPRQPSDGRIDWRAGAEQIVRLIRASASPLSGAHCLYEGELLTVWSGEVVEPQEPFLAVPGQVTEIGPGFVRVAAGDCAMVQINLVGRGKDQLTPDLLIRSIRARMA